MFRLRPRDLGRGRRDVKQGTPLLEIDKHRATSDHRPAEAQADARRLVLQELKPQPR